MVKSVGTVILDATERLKKLTNGQMLTRQASLLLILASCSGTVTACSVDAGQLKITIDKIPEQLPMGSVVGTLRFDAPFTVRRVQVIRPSEFFELKPVTYELVVKSELDVDGSVAATQPPYMQVRCENLQGVPFDIDIWFYVEDINDNYPSFVPSYTYIFNVSEGLSLSSELGQVHAVDADRDNMNIEYLILPNEHSGHFALQDKPGGYAAIMLARPLDFETSPQMKFQIVAMDCPDSGCRTDRKTSTAVITINVSDADDQNPEFVNTPYETTILDNVTWGFPVICLKAVDLDTTLNATIQFELISSDNVRDIYQVNGSSGLVTVKNPSLLQQGYLYLLQVRAYQSSDPSKRDSATVVVRVIPANNQAPHFDRRLYEVYTMESTPILNQILAFSVSDSDPNPVLKFTMKPADLAVIFRTEVTGPTTGALFLQQSLDFERRRLYNLSLSVSNPHNVDTATILVHVIDANDNDPVFEAPNYEFIVNGTYCGTVRATDKDIGTTITYRLMGRPPYKQLFSVSKTGEVKLTGSVSQYTSDTYFLTVLAMDDGDPPRTGATSVALNMASYAASKSTSLELQQGGIDGYVAYLLGATAAILLVVVIILVLCLLRRSTRQAAMKDRPQVDNELTVKASDGSYMAMQRVSAEQISINETRQRNEANRLPESPSSSMKHRDCSPMSCKEFRLSAAEQTNNERNLSKHIYTYNLEEIPSVFGDNQRDRTAEHDCLSKLSPEIWQPHGCKEADMLTFSVMGKPPISSSHVQNEAQHWRGSSKPASTSGSCSSGSTLHTYEERRADESSDACDLVSHEVVKRKSSMVENGSTRAGGSRKASAHKESELGSHDRHRHKSLEGSVQPKKTLLRKKALAKNKESMLYGDQSPLNPGQSVTPFVRQCSLSPTLHVGNGKKVIANK